MSRRDVSESQRAACPEIVLKASSLSRWESRMMGPRLFICKRGQLNMGSTRRQNPVGPLLIVAVFLGIFVFLVVRSFSSGNAHPQSVTQNR